MSGLVPSPENCLIFDIGGGSEFVLYQSGEILFHCSYPFGVVSLSEQYPLPSQQSIVIEKAIDVFFADLLTTGTDPVQLKLWPLFGMAGTITTLFAVHLGLIEYDSRLDKR